MTTATGISAEILQSIPTPDRVESRLGPLELDEDSFTAFPKPIDSASVFLTPNLG